MPASLVGALSEMGKLFSSRVSLLEIGLSDFLDVCAGLADITLFNRRRVFISFRQTILLAPFLALLAWQVSLFRATELSQAFASFLSDGHCWSQY